MTQPPAFPQHGFNVFEDQGAEVYPVEQAIREALKQS